MKILLVEDNPGDARLLEEMLKEVDAAHYEIEHAESLEGALQLLDEKAFDLVLLDLGLPGSIGLDTFHTVYSRIPSTPIIVLTGFGDDTFVATAREAGVKNYLNKNTVDCDLLFSTIKEATEQIP